jgi:hypothetical protein
MGDVADKIYFSSLFIEPIPECLSGFSSTVGNDNKRSGFVLIDRTHYYLVLLSSCVSGSSTTLGPKLKSPPNPEIVPDML